MSKEESVLAIHMGEAFDRLSPLLQKAHIGKNCLRGTAKVERGNALAQIICTVFRFPKANPESNLSVECEHSADAMSWKRNFDGLKMESNFKKEGEYLVEYLGPLAMSFKAVEEKGALSYQFVKTKCFGIPMPNFLSPQVEAGEQELNGKYHFSVLVKMFLVGKVIAYSGELTLEAL